MNANLPLLGPTQEVPERSHWEPLTDEQCREIDSQMLADKKASGYKKRAEAAALAHQIATQDKAGAA